MTQPLNIAQMVRKVGLRIGLNASAQPIGSGDLKLEQLVELFNEEVYELGTQFQWQALTKEVTFSTVADEDQGVFYGDGGLLLPATMFHYVISDTMYDRTSRVPIPGPLSSEDWQTRKALGYTTGPYPQYRVRDNRLILLPQPAAGHTVAFEYANKKFVIDDAGDYDFEFTDNDQRPVLDCDVIMAGVRWRWKAAKGFPYAEEKRTWERAALNAGGRQVGNMKLNAGGGNSASSGGRGGNWTSSAI
jgi:hypothetical protein